MENNGFSVSCVIIMDKKSNSYYGIVKEVEGVVVKGTSEQEVKEKIPKAIKAIMTAKRKAAESLNPTVGGSDAFTISEYEQPYIACQ